MMSFLHDSSVAECLPSVHLTLGSIPSQGGGTQAHPPSRSRSRGSVVQDHPQPLVDRVSKQGVEKGWREGRPGVWAQGQGVARPLGHVPNTPLLSYSLLFMVPVACGLFPQEWYQRLLPASLYQTLCYCSE